MNAPSSTKSAAPTIVIAPLFVIVTVPPAVVVTVLSEVAERVTFFAPIRTALSSSSATVVVLLMFKPTAAPMPTLVLFGSTALPSALDVASVLLDALRVSVPPALTFP